MIEYKTIKCEFKEVPKEGNYHVINPRGDQFWFVDNNEHRDNDKPAVIYADGTQVWFKMGKLHRDNDLPTIIWSDGSRHWFQNNKLHRDNYLPAVIYSSGHIEYWYDSKQYTKKEYFDMLLAKVLISENGNFAK